MQAEKLLVISCRDESYDDFVNIGKRVNRLDGSIIVSVHNGSFDPAQLPPQLNHLRLLSLYLVNPPSQIPKRGHTLAVANLGKAEEYDGFVAAGVPIPKARPFQIGDTIDAEEWGDYVVLKPVHLSLGIGVMLVPTQELGALSRDAVPTEHPLSSTPYLVQQYIDTGPHICGYRVLCFLGTPLICYQVTDQEPIRYPATLADSLSRSMFAIGEKQRQRTLCFDAEVLDFAQRAFNAHPELPLQGIDIIREARSGKLYVLENNSGGNVWTFSRKASLVRQYFGAKALVNQFKAWDRAAEVLVKKTNELAK